MNNTYYQNQNPEGDLESDKLGEGLHKPQGAISDPSGWSRLRPEEDHKDFLSRVPMSRMKDSKSLVRAVDQCLNKPNKRIGIEEAMREVHEKECGGAQKLGEITFISDEKNMSGSPDFMAELRKWMSKAEAERKISDITEIEGPMMFVIEMEFTAPILAIE